MAYVPGANRDIFICYPIEAEDWAQHFEQDLQKELQQWLPAHALQIYLAKRDWRLAPSDDMLEQARHAFFFVATLVPGALQDDGSRFFQDEWQAFNESTDKFGSVETRFAPVLIKPIDVDRLTQFFPPEGEESFWNTFKFYFKDQTGVPHTLARGSRKSVYSKKIREIAWHIAERLKEQTTPGHRRSETGQSAAKGPFKGMSVIIAAEEEQITGQWEEVRKLLQNDGASVAFDGKYPADDKEFEELLKRELPRAKLFVQLLSPLDEAQHQATRSTEGHLTRAQIAYNCALEHLKTNPPRFSILQWRDPKIRSDVLKYWPEELLNSQHVHAVGLEQFKRTIRATLEDLSRAPPPPTAMPLGGRPFLFITADRSDLPLAADLSKAALDHADVDVLSEIEQDRKEQFVEAMKIAKGVIILHGSAPVQFVNNWLSFYVREKAKLNRNPKLDALYRAPPLKASNEEPRIPTRDLRSLGSEERFTLEGIQQLCTELGGESQ